MDWATASVAITAAVVSATVATYVAVKTISNQATVAKEDRQHSRAMARDDRRSSAYFEMLTALRRLMDGVERTEPIMSSPGDPRPPPPLPDEELWRLNALTAAFASNKLRPLMREWNRKQQEFYSEVWYLTRMRQEEERFSLGGGEVESRFGVSQVDQLKKVHGLRDDLRARLEAIDEQVRRELGTET